MLQEQMSIDLGIDPFYIKNISKRNSLYARYLIKKKNGGFREILHPSKELKVLQHWVCQNIFSHFPVSQYSFAYQKGCSIKRNANNHRYNNYILHTDISNFFPSITRKHILHLFSLNPEITKILCLAPNDIELICDIVLYRGKKLVVGSVASPLISNVIMYSFDLQLMALLREQIDCNYTRYADDIIISSKNFIPEKIIPLIKEVMNSYDFTINQDKTYFMSKCSCRRVTGVVIDNNSEQLSIGNAQYKAFQREIYNFLVKQIGEISHISGYLSHIKNINPFQYQHLIDTYRKYDKQHIIFKIE